MSVEEAEALEALVEDYEKWDIKHAKQDMLHRMERKLHRREKRR